MKMRANSSAAVVTIAHQLSHASAKQTPLTLLALNNVLEGDEWSAREKESIRRQIWKCDLLHIIVEVLRQDFSLVPGQWGTAAKLATLLSDVCVCLKPKIPEQQGVASSGEEAERVAEYYDILLPTAVDSLLILANSLAELGAFPATRDDLRAHFLAVVDALTWLCSTHQQCIQRALLSPYLLNILISDEAAYSGPALSFMAAMLKVYPGVFTTLPSETLRSVLDELVYKVSGTDSQPALEALNLLGAFVENQILSLDDLISEYNGLGIVVSKWRLYQLGPNASQLVVALEAKAAVVGEGTKMNSAAIQIQAVWRGYVCRKKMKLAKRGICRFQQLYRRWKSSKKKVKQEKAHTINRPTSSTHKKFYEQKISTLKLLPPSCEVDAFLRQEEEKAATRLQAWWRGTVTRKAFQEIKMAALRTKSAAVIQKAIRRHLQKGKYQTMVEGLYPLLTSAERELLQQDVSQKMREQCPTQSSGPRSQLHDQVQDLLGDFYANLRLARQRDEKRHMTLSNLTECCGLALSAPSLCQASDDLVELYSSGSRAVAMMALKAHREEVRAMQLPWWKRLSSEEDTVCSEDAITSLLA